MNEPTPAQLATAVGEAALQLTGTTADLVMVRASDPDGYRQLAQQLRDQWQEFYHRLGALERRAR